VAVHVYRLTSKVATRQYDYFSDGTSRVVETSVEDYGQKRIPSFRRRPVLGKHYLRCNA